MDAIVSNEAALSGSNSLKIEGVLSGGPMDVVLIAGLEGIYDVRFHVLVPQGSSGYYNVQENLVPGVGWAFECNLGSDGNITRSGSGCRGPKSQLPTTMEAGLKSPVIDTDADVTSIYVDGLWVGELPYDGEQIGGINFTLGAMARRCHCISLTIFPSQPEQIFFELYFGLYGHHGVQLRTECD